MNTVDKAIWQAQWGGQDRTERKEGKKEGQETQNPNAKERIIIIKKKSKEREQKESES